MKMYLKKKIVENLQNASDPLRPLLLYLNNHQLSISNYFQIKFQHFASDVLKIFKKTNNKNNKIHFTLMEFLTTLLISKYVQIQGAIHEFNHIYNNDDELQKKFK
jgi:hypothetical protein